MNELIQALRELVNDVNVEEIADHLNEEALWNWCGAWREEANEILDIMEAML